MRFTNPIDVWGTPVEQLARLQPGQHVYAGTRDHRGVFCGVKRSGVIVVAGHQNIYTRPKADRLDYLRCLIQYAH